MNVSWRKTWLVVILLFLGITISWEMTLRAYGHRPSVVDDYDLWSSVRDSIDQQDKNTVVLLGASRIQLGFCTETFRRRFSNYHLAQLAINGRSPLATLKDLAEDESFSGTVICSVTCQSLNSKALKDQQSYVDYFHNRYSLNSRLNRVLLTAVQNDVVFVNPHYRLIEIAKDVKHSKKLPRPIYVRTFPDRSRKADYSSRSELQLRRKVRLKTDRQQDNIHQPTTNHSQKWLSDTEVVEPFVNKIKSRGGEVLFLRMPTSGEQWERDELITPKNLFWDQFAKSTTAQTIHFQDVETLRNFRCPDRSHLDQRDAPKFTNALLDELLRRKFLINSGQ